MENFSMLVGQQVSWFKGVTTVLAPAMGLET